MPFPFTFIFNVPGIISPFASKDPEHFVSASTIQESPSKAGWQEQQLVLSSHKPQQGPASIPPVSRSQLLRISRPPPPSIELSRSPTPVSRKRGWHPAFAEPSASTTTLTATSGYLYPPERSGDYFMGSIWSQNPHIASNEPYQQDLYEEEEMPPLKKRRGLAGTIISTALNAALIGSAVGLSVYRLWRNRGKPPQPPVEVATEPSLEALPPPPPYDAPSHHKPAFCFPEPEPVPTIPLSPPSSIKRLRNTQHQRQNKRTATQHRRRKSHRTHPDHHSVSDPVLDDEAEDQMDWIGDKLSMLIEQGKRALNAQVVVSSDVIEDEVDDGSDAWEEENGMDRSSPRKASRSRSGSVRHCKRPRTLNLGSTSYAASSSTPSPRFADFNLPASSSVPNTSFIGGGMTSRYATLLPASQSVTSLNNVSIEDPSTFDSPELRESMEMARRRLMARRLGGA